MQNSKGMIRTMMRKTVALLLVVIAGAGWVALGGQQNPASLELLWETEAEDGSALYSAVHQGCAVLFTTDGEILRRELVSGTIRSVSSLGFVPASKPALDKGIAFIADNKGGIGAYRLSTGQRLWHAQTDIKVLSDIALYAGFVLVGGRGDANRLWGFSVQTGELILSVALPDGIGAPPTGDRTTIFVPTRGGDICAIDSRTGSVLGIHKTRGQFSGQKVVPYRNRLLISPTGYHRSVECLDTKTGGFGRLLWGCSFERSEYTDAAQLNEIAFLRPGMQAEGLKKVLAKSRRFAGKAIDPSTDFIPTGPVYTSGWVVEGDQAAVVVREPGFPPFALYQVILVDIQTGERIISYQNLAKSTVSSSCVPPIVTKTSVVAAIGPNRIISIAKENGQIEWEQQIGDGGIADLMLADKNVLVKTLGGKVAAYGPPLAVSHPSMFMLFENSPNPFTTLTTIRYNIPSKCLVTVSVTNSMGQTVTTLVNERMNPGFYSTIWNGLNAGGEPVAAGAYFIALQGGKYRRSIRATLIR